MSLDLAQRHVSNCTQLHRAILDACLTKPITSAAIFSLIEITQLQLIDKVFGPPVSRARNVTSGQHLTVKPGTDSGLAARLHGHGYQSADQDNGEELANDGFGYRKRTRERMQRRDTAADGGKRSETEIGQLRRKLVHIRRRADGEGAREQLLNQLKGGEQYGNGGCLPKLGTYCYLLSRSG